MKFYFYIFLLILVDIAAISTSKQWQISNKKYWLFISMIFFCAMPIFFGYATRYAPSAITNAVWVACSTVFIAITGYFIFKETITPWQMIGLAIITLGLILLELKR